MARRDGETGRYETLGLEGIHGGVSYHYIITLLPSCAGHLHP